jgi:DNA-binding response OmpR family regulator
VPIGSQKSILLPAKPPPLEAHQRISALIVAAQHDVQLAAQLSAPNYNILQLKPDQALSLLAGAGYRGVLVVDCRNAVSGGIDIFKPLGTAAQQHGLPLLALVHHDDEAILSSLFELGATHFLPAPFTALELTQAVRFANRYLDRQRNSDMSLHSKPPSRSVDQATGLATEAFARERIGQLIAAEPQGAAAALVIVAISRFATHRGAAVAAFGSNQPG